MRQFIAPCVKEQPFSVIRTMVARTLKYENVLSLSIGEPDFDTPAFVCAAAGRDAAHGYTHYAPSTGDADLRRALLEHIQATQGISLGAENLLLTTGAMNGLLAVMRTLLDVGDEVLTLAPYFSDYAGHVRLTGAHLVPVCTYLEDGFLPRMEALEQAVTPRTRVLLLNSPCNPTGAVLSPATLDALADFARRHDLVVIADEVYNSIVADGPVESIYTRPGMAERTVVLNSFSKAYAMTGWRVGYAFGPAWITEHMMKVISYSTASASTIGQRAALAALQGPQEEFTAIRAAFVRRNALVARRLAAMKGVECVAPAGAFYSFPRFAAAMADSEAFALDVLDKVQVVLVPGAAFGPLDCTRGCVRMACTLNESKLNEAMDRLEHYLATYCG